MWELQPVASAHRVIPAFSPRRCNGEPIDSRYEPFTSSFFWYTMEGLLQRVLFSLTMGIAALLFSALLWTASLPLVAWNVVRWVASEVGRRFSTLINSAVLLLVFRGRPVKM